MALLTVQEQISTLLQRNLVEDKTRGTPSVQVEAAAVMDSVALNFVFNPRTVLYFAHLARNALFRLVDVERLTALALMQTVRDLGNQSFALRELKALERAKTSLLQIETQGQILSTEGAFQGFDSAAKEFLDKQLSKNVRRQGTSSLVRPSVEAAATLPSEYATVTALHSQVAARLKYLMRGVREFSISSLAGTLGINAAFRVRKDVESIITDLEADPTAAGSREYAVRLSAARTALRLLGTPPGIFDPKVSTTKSLPYGYSLSGASAASSFEQISSTPEPWSVPFGTVFQYTVGPVAGVFPIYSLTYALDSTPSMRSPASPGYNIPPQGGLFFDMGGGTTFRVVINDTSSWFFKTPGDVVAAINAQASAYVVARVVPQNIPGAIILLDSVGISSLTMSPFRLTDTISVPHSGSTSGSPTVWTNSARTLLGLPEGSDDGVRTASDMAAYLNGCFGVSFFSSENAHLVARVPLAPGQTASIVAPGIFASVPPAPAYSAEVSLVGTYLGKAIAPPAPSLVSRGDVLTASTGTSKVSSATGSTVLLEDVLPVFEGPIAVESGLVKMWQSLQLALDAFSGAWAKGGSVDRMDSTIASLYSSPTPARRNDAIKALQVLVDTLESLQTVLSSSPLSSDVSAERAIAEGIMSTLTERKFDRAQSFLLQGRFVEVFSLDWQTASFSGELLSSATEVAQNDLTWPQGNSEEQSNVPYATDDSLEVQ
jgi:hypothetical protein